MRLLECLKNVYIKMDENLIMYSVRAHLQGEYEDMKDCYKTLLTYIKVGIVSFFLPSSPPSYKRHEGMGRGGKEGGERKRGGGEEREGREGGGL